jgi:hypothetical protein
MDLKQRKLTKSEWEGIEIPVNKDEMEILNLIVNGFSNIHLKVNKTETIFTHLKIDYSTQIEEFLYAKFFADKIKNLIEKYQISFIHFKTNTSRKIKNIENNDDYYINIDTIVKLKSSDQIRLSRLNTNNMSNDLYEFILYNNLEHMLNYKYTDNQKWMYYYYTLCKLL